MSDQTFNFRTAQTRQSLRFSIVDGPLVGKVLPPITLPEPGESPILIGRSRECAIWIDASDISRRHTEIFSSPERRPVIRDMGSVNGTLVNGQPVSNSVPIPLNPGDHIRVGLTELRFDGVLTQTPPSSQSIPPSYYPTPSPIITQPPTSKPGGSFVPPPGAGITAPAPLRAATLPGEYYIYLVIRSGQRYMFEGEEVTVGRGQANDIVIDSNSISRQHARLQKTVTGVLVTDMGSTNKTFVNGVQADGPVLLRDGDVIRFGEVEVDFKLEPQRLTNYVPQVGRRSNDSTANLHTSTDAAAEITQRDNSSSEMTFVGNVGDQTFVGEAAAGVRPPSFRSNLEQAETALDLDIRVVGRNLRQAVDVMPEAGSSKPIARTSSGALVTEVARLEGVYLTEGQGRAKEIILSDIRLGLKPGELVALVGPSGSGKSELLKVMAGLQAADRGLVAVMGRRLPTMENMGGTRPNLETDKELTRWRLRALGYLPSELDLNPRLTALEQVIWVLEQAGYGRDPLERVERAKERLQFVGLTDPNILALRSTELTRTECKLLALARILALDPPLFLADEPTGKVPSSAADKIFNLLQQLVASGKTVFMVTSDQLWARNANRQIEILDGTIVGGLS
jgi:putative ABC transport system ATP-binding protein